MLVVGAIVGGILSGIVVCALVSIRNHKHAIELKDDLDDPESGLLQDIKGDKKPKDKPNKESTPDPNPEQGGGPGNGGKNEAGKDSDPNNGGRQESDKHPQGESPVKPDSKQDNPSDSKPKTQTAGESGTDKNSKEGQKPDPKADGQDDSKPGSSDPSKDEKPKTETPLVDVRSQPVMKYEDREHQADMSKLSADRSTFGLITLFNRLKHWAFQSFHAMLEKPHRQGVRECTVIYGMGEVGHPHPLVNMFEICKRFDGMDITPEALYLSDPKEYEVAYSSYMRHDTIVMEAERFLVIERLRDRIIDFFAREWNKIEVVKRYIKYVIDAVDALEKFHKGGYYIGNLEPSSFYLREKDGKVIIGDLWGAEPGFYGKNLFMHDLAVIPKLIDIMDWHGEHTDHDIFTTEMTDDFHEIRYMLRDYVGLHKRPDYETIRKILKKYI